MRRHLRVLMILAMMGGIGACDSTPTSPSGTNGITLNGAVVAPGSGGGSTGTASTNGSGSAAFIPAGLTVTVVGTTVTAQVTASGQFILRNVPPGTVELRFTAAGLTATVTLLDLQAGQMVTVTISLQGSLAALESDRRSLGSEEQLEGRVESVPPTTAALTFMAAGRLVTTDANTQFYLRGATAAFSSLEIGQRVHVKGVTGGGSLLARVVDIQNTNTEIGVPINGIVSSFSGTAAAFQFEVNGKLVKGDAGTEFFGNSQFADLANGKQVEVKGSLRDGFVYAARLHVAGH